jgi:hypothetical protein
MSRKALWLVLVAVAAGGSLLAPGCGRSSDVAAGGAGGGPPPGQGGGGGIGDVIEFEACVETESTATLVPVNMFIAVDKSGSMMDNNKWEDTEAAFTAFFQSAVAGPLRVALRFWPDTGCDDMTCDVDACATPEVALGELSDTAHQQALIDAFAARMPEGGTPMSAALEGAVQWSRTYLASITEEERVVIILVTDGEPNGCVEDPAAIAAIAGDAFTSDEIQTFAVGLAGSAEPTMNGIATAGGTQAGIFIGTGNAEEELRDALLAIAGEAVQCSFDLPEPMPGEQIDPRLVRVEYTPEGSGTPGLLPHVSDEAACAAGGGWYYDNNQNPTRITLCPETCGQVQADTQALVDVALGCECEVDEECPGELICVDNHCTPGCDVTGCEEGFFCGDDNRCHPNPGDPCESDLDCPAGLVCFGGQCSQGGIIVGPYEAVQGGAFNCHTTGPRREDNGGSTLLLSLLLSYGIVSRRRRAR